MLGLSARNCPAQNKKEILSIYFSAEFTEEMLQKECDLSLTQGEIKLINSWRDFWV